MQIACRDVILVPFPFRDRLAEKTRPAVVVSSDQYNSQGDCIIAAITSHPARTSFDVDLVDWQAAGLQKPSTVRLLLATVAESRIILNIGSLSAEDWGEVVQRLKMVFP